MEELPPVFVFKLGGSEYAIEASRLVEVREGISVTPLPFSSPSLLGIGNLRGEIVPILDLGKILHGEPSKGSLFIIVEGKTGKVGLKVDEVYKIEYPSEYKKTRQKGMVQEILGKYISGVLKLSGERFVSLLNLERILEDARGGS